MGWRDDLGVDQELLREARETLMREAKQAQQLRHCGPRACGKRASECMCFGR